MSVDPTTVTAAIRRLPFELELALGNLELLTKEPTARAETIRSWSSESQTLLVFHGATDDQGNLTPFGYDIAIKLLSPSDRAEYAIHWLPTCAKHALARLDVSPGKPATHKCAIAQMGPTTRHVLTNEGIIDGDFNLTPLGVAVVLCLQEQES